MDSLNKFAIKRFIMKANNSQKVIICIGTFQYFLASGEGSLCGMEANVQDREIVESEFEIHSCYYIHFWTNALEIGIISYGSLFYMDSFSIK